MRRVKHKRMQPRSTVWTSDALRFKLVVCLLSGGHELAPQSVPVDSQDEEYILLVSDTVAIEVSKQTSSTCHYHVNHKRAWLNCEDIMICTEILRPAILVKDLNFNFQPLPRLCLEAL